MPKNLNNALDYYKFSMPDDEIEDFNNLPQPLLNHLQVMAFYADKFRIVYPLMSDCLIFLEMTSGLYDEEPLGKDAAKLYKKVDYFLSSIESKQ